MIRLITLILVIGLLSGCETFNLKRSVPDEVVASTKRVGVASFLGSTFDGVLVGITVFGNENFSASVPDWRVDEKAVQKSILLLKSNPRFDTAAVDLGNFTVAQVRAKPQILWDAARSQGFDHLIIVHPGISDNYPSFKPGYGFYERRIPGIFRSCVYVASIVEFYDVAAQKIIGWEWGGSYPCNLSKNDDIRFKSKFEEFSAADQEKLKERTDARLAESLQYALTKLSLMPETGTSK